MSYPEAKSLFQLQTELIDNKVELAVSKAIQPVIDQIIDLKQEMHREIGGLRHEMHEMKHELSNRLTAVETVLGMRNKLREEVRTRFFDYAFKAGWLILGSALTYFVVHGRILL
jgi:hypothetical protein